jgi:hypothetical protein
MKLRFKQQDSPDSGLRFSCPNPFLAFFCGFKKKTTFAAPFMVW